MKTRIKVLKVISGGQTGADMGGLLAARKLKVKTGGYCPSNYWTENGKNEKLKDFGLKPFGSYKDRTLKNIKKSDFTIVFGDNTSVGSKLTTDACARIGRQFFLVKNFDKKELESIMHFLTNYFVYVLKILSDKRQKRVIKRGLIINIAGNRESKNKGIEKRTCKFVKKLIRAIENSEVEIKWPKNLNS